MTTAKVVNKPGIKDDGKTQDDPDEPLSEVDALRYRALVARCDHLAPDTPDLAYAVNELAGSTPSPTRGDWTRLKRLGRYALERKRLKQWFPWQHSQYKLVTYSDADWAGCRVSRKSTTGGFIIVGQHATTGWSKTQTLVALSAGESELCATL